MMNNDNVAPGDKAMILLQSLICYLREKNVLSRADIEALRNRVQARMATPDSGLSCATALVAAAVHEMWELDDYCGKKRPEEHKSEFKARMRTQYALSFLKNKKTEFLF